MKTNQIKLGIILSYLTMFIQNIFSILYTPIMLRLLGKNEYGLYQLVSSVISYLGLLNFGFGSAYIRFYSKFKVKNDDEGIAKLNGMFMSIFLIIAIITLIAGYILILNIEVVFSYTLTMDEINTARILMILMVINLAISFPLSVFDSFVTAHENYFFQRLIVLFQIIANPLLTLPLLFLGYKSISMVIITTILTFFKLMINMYYCFKVLKIKFIFKDFQFSLLNEIWIFSFYIFLNMIVDQVNWNLDKFILGIFGGTAMVAIYSIGSQINLLYMNLSTSISTVFIPRINYIVAKGGSSKELTQLLTQVGRIQFMILSLVLSGFLVFGKYFIQIWAGNEYMTAYYISLILMISVTCPLIQNLGIEIQRAKNMHRFRSIIYFMIAVVNCLLSIPLSQTYGEVGAACATAVSLIIGNIIIMNYFYHFKVKLNMVYFWKEITKVLPGIFISLIAGLSMVFLLKIESLLNFIVEGILYTVIYLIVIYFFSMNVLEKKLLTNTIKKVLKR